MQELIDNFTNQLEEAVAIGENAKLSNLNARINHVLISGLGGSGIGGTIVSQLIAKDCKLPILVNKDYFVPAYVSENTLAVFSSYSGNTEETLYALELAEAKKAQIVCITSGGKLLEIAKNKGYDYIQIPSGYPPRAAFGFSSVQLLYLFHKYGLISNAFKTQLIASISFLRTEKESIKKEAKTVANQLLGKLPIIYSDASFEGVSVRLRQQINENSKMLCWHHAIPEMNHNELVGWREKNENLAVIILRNETDFDRTQQRIELNKEIINNYTSTIIEIWSKGNSILERAYYLIHLGDWVSSYLADLKQIDSTEVKVIDFLKGELAKK